MPAEFSTPSCSVRGAAHLDDLRDRRQRLDVVDQRRRGVQAGDGRERRLRPRLAAAAFERLEQAGLLAADVGAGAAVHDDGEVPAGAEHVLADEAGLAGLLERRGQDLVLGQVLAADVDERQARADRVRGDEDALDEQVRDARHQLAVLERPRLGLVGVDHEIDRLRRVLRLRQEAGLAAHGEAGAAAAAHVGGEQLVQHRLALHADRLAQRAVAADGLVLGELRQVAGVRVLEEQLPKRHRAAP